MKKCHINIIWNSFLCFTAKLVHSFDMVLFSLSLSIFFQIRANAHNVLWKLVWCSKYVFKVSKSSSPILAAKIITKYPQYYAPLWNFNKMQNPYVYAVIDIFCLNLTAEIVSHQTRQQFFQVCFPILLIVCELQLQWFIAIVFCSELRRPVWSPAAVARQFRGLHVVHLNS